MNGKTLIIILQLLLSYFDHIWAQTFNVITIAGSGAVGTGNGQATTAQFQYPASAVVDPSNGNIYVADTYNNLVRKIDTVSMTVSTFASGFFYPWGIVMDSLGNLFVTENVAIKKITPLGSVSTFVSVGSSTGGTDRGISIDSSRNLYVGDIGENKIFKITPGASVSTLAGSGTYGYLDGPATVASFRYPTGVAVDSFGSVYVADRKNARIRS